MDILKTIRLMSFLSLFAFVLRTARLASGWHRPSVILPVIYIVVLDSLRTFTNQAITANAVVVIRWKESTFITPATLLNTLFEAPMPELADRAQTLSIHCQGHRRILLLHYYGAV